MPTLYYSAGACSLAPHIVLEWIGEAFEPVAVKTGSTELLEVNPAGAVPTLREDDGWLLTQAPAILEYLAQKHPEAGLTGGDGLRQKAETQRWLSFLASDMHAAFWPIFMPERYTTDTSDEARAKAVEAGKVRAHKQFKALNAHLEGRDWIRDERSIVDAYAFPMIRWGIKLLDGLKDYPNVLRLHEALKADPAVKTVLDREAGKA